MWVHLRLSCHALSCTFVPEWMWGIYSLGQNDMQYISMTGLLCWGHECSMCTWGAKLTLSSSKRGQNHTASPYISRLMEQYKKNLQLCINIHVNLSGSSFFSFSILPVSQFNQSSILLTYFKARYPLMMPDKIITGVIVKHIMGYHESPESSEDIFFRNSCVFWRVRD